jgi:hypothetical protein
MDLNLIIQEQTDKIIESKLPELVEQKVSDMLNGILKDIFSTYGDTSKKIKAKIEESLDVSLAQFSLTDYNALVAQTIASELEKEIDINPIKNIVRSIVGKSDLKQITLTDLCEKIKVLDMDNNNDDYGGEITFGVIEDAKHGWLEIYADLKAEEGKNTSRVVVLVSKDSGTIFSMKTSDYHNLNKNLSPSSAVGLYEPLEKLFFELYNNQVMIINDYEDYYLTWDRD